MYCTNCGAEIDENDASCPYCGYLNPYGAERKYMKELEVIRVKTDKEEENREVNFKTSPAGTIPNLNFDDWYQDGKVWYAASNSSTRVWDSANKGAASLIGSTTTPETGSNCSI